MFRHLLRTALIGAPLTRQLFHRPVYSMAFMQLFERNKTPAELSPVFKRETKQKGHLKHKNMKNYSNKLNKQVRKPKQKLKNHKGLLKRVKIVHLMAHRWDPATLAS